MDRIGRGEKAENKVFAPYVTEGQSIKNISGTKESQP